jgi:hypothetical protein
LRIAEIADQGAEVNVAHESRIKSCGTCHKGGVVLSNGNTSRGDRIPQHLELAGTAFSLVYPWALQRKSEGMAIWNTSADAGLWAMQDIVAAVEQTFFPDGKVGFSLPLQRRG